jgi:hypothetical protein
MTNESDARSKAGIAAIVDEADLYASFTARLMNGLRDLQISSPSDRRSLVRLLEFLKDMLGELMDEPLGAVGKTPLVAEHPTTQALREHASALRDLDDGVVDEVLRPSPLGGNLASTRDANTALAAAALADTIRAKFKVSSEEAAKRAAKALEKTGCLFQGRKITAKRILPWQRYLPRVPREPKR